MNGIHVLALPPLSATLSIFALCWAHRGRNWAGEEWVAENFTIPNFLETSQNGDWGNDMASLRHVPDFSVTEKESEGWGGRRELATPVIWR